MDLYELIAQYALARSADPDGWCPTPALDLNDEHELHQTPPIVLAETNWYRGKIIRCWSESDDGSECIQELGAHFRQISTLS